MGVHSTYYAEETESTIPLHECRATTCRRFLDNAGDEIENAGSLFGILMRRGFSSESLYQTGGTVGRQVDTVRKNAERGELGLGPGRLRECYVRNVDIPEPSLTD